MKTFITYSVLVLIAAMLISCSQDEEVLIMNDDMHKTYSVARFDEPIPIDADWDKPQWQDIEPLDIELYMGVRPRHFPKVQAKVAYDDNNIYVIFRVEDNYIRAVAQQHHDPVYKDSCVEFFFTPSSDITTGYMNLEANCCGKILFNYQKEKGVGVERVSLEDIDKIEIAHSLPYDTIPEEIQVPTTWTLEYRIPFDVIENYIPVERPQRGVMWWANFYKCADDSSHPHWLTWSLVDKPQPDFHRPEYFGTLVFE